MKIALRHKKLNRRMFHDVGAPGNAKFEYNGGFKAQWIIPLKEGDS